MSISTRESRQPFDADGVSIGDFLDKAGTGIYIPLYQRRYRWTKANAERLFTTIADGIARWHPSVVSSTFLGTVITVADPNTFPPAKALALPSAPGNRWTAKNRDATLHVR